MLVCVYLKVLPFFKIVFAITIQGISKQRLPPRLQVSLQTITYLKCERFNHFIFLY